MTTNNYPLCGWKIIKAVDLGEYGARNCELCRRELRYLIITRDTDGILRGLGAECASRVENTSARDLAYLQRCIFKEDHRVSAATALLPAGFLVPPAPALNGYPIVPVVYSLRFSLLPTITPQAFHICSSGYWSRCVEDECRHCAERNPIAARLHGVCVWKLNRDGSLYMPDEWKWPYGCTSFRALALRDSDVSVMRSLRGNIDTYDWQIDRGTSTESSDSVRVVGASSLRLAGDFVSNLV